MPSGPRHCSRCSAHEPTRTVCPWGRGSRCPWLGRSSRGEPRAPRGRTRPRSRNSQRPDYFFSGPGSLRRWVRSSPHFYFGAQGPRSARRLASPPERQGDGLHPARRHPFPAGCCRWRPPGRDRGCCPVLQFLRDAARSLPGRGARCSKASPSGCFSCNRSWRSRWPRSRQSLPRVRQCCPCPRQASAPVTWLWPSVARAGGTIRKSRGVRVWPESSTSIRGACGRFSPTMKR